MASTGAKLPSSGASVSSSPWSDNAWVNPGNVTAIDTTYASVTASTFDSGDQTYRLRCTGFDFSAIPDGSTINGITVKINNARYANGTGSLDLCQLVSSGTPIGNNKYSTPQALTTTATTDYTVGGTSDVWGASLTAAIVKDSSFGVDIGCLSTGANTDVYIDAVEMTVEYTEPSPPKLYYVIYASAGSEPSAAQIKAGQDATGSAAVASGNETARTTTGEEVFAAAASGLTPSTGYKVSFVWSDGTNDSNVVVTSAWSTAEPVEIDAGIGQAIAAGVQASIVDSTVISCVVGEASAHGLGAQVLAGTTIEAAIGEAVAQGLDAQIIVSAAIEATVGAAVAAGLPAGISQPAEITCGIGVALAHGLQFSLSVTTTIAAGVGAAVASGLAASVATGGAEDDNIIPFDDGGDPAYPFSNTVDSVVLAVAPTSAQVWMTLVATATVRDEFGNRLSGKTVKWSSSGGAVIAAPADSVTNALGVATALLPALAAGTTNINATAEGVSAAPITVTVTAVAAPDTYDSTGATTVIVTAVDRLASWERPRVRRFNDADQKRLHPTDRFFEGLEEASEIEIIWPSKELLRRFA